MKKEPNKRTEAPDTVDIKMKAYPGAQETRIDGTIGDVIRIRVHAIPEKGKANDEIIRFLSKTLKVPQLSIEIVYGTASREKTIRIPSGAVQTLMNLVNKAHGE